MSDIVAFLNACLDEDEQLIRDNIAWWWDSFQRIEILTANGVVAGGEQYAVPFLNPNRVRREIAAKRELLQLAADMRDRAVDCEDYVYETYADQIEFAMAKGYADRDGYNPAWRVE